MKFYDVLTICWLTSYQALLTQCRPSTSKYKSLYANDANITPGGITGRRTQHYYTNKSTWKYPNTLISFLGVASEQEYWDDTFSDVLQGTMALSHVDDEQFYPYGMYPYLFAGTNPYQFGHSEATIFQREAFLSNATKTPIESILLWASFPVYFLMWLYIEFLAILILPLTGFILFRFVCLPLGEFIGGKRTRKYLRLISIRKEKFRRDWIKWLWPKNRRLPPWRYRTPKMLRYANEGSVPWELFEEKEVHKLDMKYPERWQVERRLRKWKEKAINPQNYADKWVYKMIHRKLLRDRSMHVAPNRFKWGDSVSSTSSGTSTSSEDEQHSHRRNELHLSESKFNLSIGSETMKELSQIRSLTSPGLSRISIQSSETLCLLKDEGMYRKNYKKRRGTVFHKRTYLDELYSLKSSHRGILLDQSDTRWPSYTGNVYEKDFDKIAAPSKKLKGWNLMKMSFGPKREYNQTLQNLKRKESNKLILTKREIDQLARIERKVSDGRNGPDSTKVTYNLALLDKIRKYKNSKVKSGLRPKLSTASLTTLTSKNTALNVTRRPPSFNPTVRGKNLDGGSKKVIITEEPKKINIVKPTASEPPGQSVLKRKQGNQNKTPESSGSEGHPKAKKMKK